VILNYKQIVIIEYNEIIHYKIVKESFQVPLLDFDIVSRTIINALFNISGITRKKMTA